MSDVCKSCMLQVFYVKASGIVISANGLNLKIRESSAYSRNFARSFTPNLLRYPMVQKETVAHPMFTVSWIAFPWIKTD